MINPKDPAHPIISKQEILTYPGMTIELEIASRILAGWAANGSWSATDNRVSNALYIARLLIAEANKE